MDGFEFLEESSRGFGREFVVVVIMLTSSINPQDEARAGQYAVIHDYLSKLLTPEQLSSIARVGAKPRARRIPALIAAGR